MDINLEKIDTIRERTGVSYREAKDVLERNNGDLVEALIELEELEGKNDKNWTDSLGNAGNEVVEELKKMIRKGNVTRVILKKDGEVLLNIPVTAGAIGVVLAPIAAILGVSAAVASRATVEIVKNNGEVVDLNDMAEGKVNDFRNKFRGNKTNTTESTTEVKVDVDLNEELENLDDGVDK